MSTERDSNEVAGGGSALNVGLELLPCPFCGADVTMGHNNINTTREWHQVECDECGAIAGSGYTTDEAAAKNWNRRSPNTELTGRPPTTEL